MAVWMTIPTPPTRNDTDDAAKIATTRRPRPMTGGERGERNDRQALKDRADERHEPSEHLEDEAEVAEHGGLGEL